MTKVIGVFGNDSDLEIALNRLYEQGFNDVQVIDRHYEAPAVPSETAVAAGLGAANHANHNPSAAAPVPLFLPGFFGLSDASMTGAYLLDRASFTDMSDEEAEWYANAVRDGGKLLIVEADPDSIGAIRHVLLNSNASQYTRL